MENLTVLSFARPEMILTLENLLGLSFKENVNFLGL